MPGAPLLQTLVLSRASDVPRFAREALLRHEVNANPILPILNKCYVAERAGQVIRDHFWIVVYTCDPQYEVKLIMSCTDGYTGNYPIFLFTPIPTHLITSDDTIYPGLRSIVRELLARVSMRRVYSVFAPEILSRTFATIWTTKTGIRSIMEPYYAAKISYLTPVTLTNMNRECPLPANEVCNLRPAVPGDIHEVAKLGYDFAAESPPFTLNQSGAYSEAHALIKSSLVWVHTLSQHGGPERIVSIVAFTRNSEKVATITKVYTDPNCRGRRCAERLVRRVCKYLFTQLRKEKIALFVGLDNMAANVYQRVGFVGIGQAPAPAEGVDTWVEIGFDREQVSLGHW